MPDRNLIAPTRPAKANAGIAVPLVARQESVEEAFRSIAVLEVLSRNAPQFE